MFNILMKEIFLLQRFQIYALLFLLVFTLSSCFQKYYNTNTVGKTDPGTLEKLQAEHKSFIVHTPDTSFALKNVTIDQEIISGNQTTLDPQYEKYLVAKTEGANRLRMKESGIILNEVHLYTNSEFSGKEKVNLAVNQIFRMDVYGFDHAATKKSRAFSIIGIAVVPVTAIAILAVMFSSWDSQPTMVNWH